ncbi:type II/IV secretion system protein [Colwellia sp. UCD-KL20]|uniref:GspE/PulE family protein n=1 Tax=Colwellia sp. UCD-KL20 TaxID=1917165 RepID=UPI001177C000|nr:type II/IV secretion system protein [Colwellia sp. UCD-KL20]
MWNSKVEDYIRHHEIIDNNRLDEAKNYQASSGHFIEQILSHSGWIDEEQLCEMYCHLLSLSHWIHGFQLTSAQLLLLDNVNFKFLAKYQMIPVHLDDGTLTIAICSPHNQEAFDYSRFLPYSVNFACITEKDFELFQEQYKAMLPNAQQIDISGDNVEMLKELALGAPTVNLVNNLINKGIKLGASDLHIEPINGRFRARYRIDGILKEADPIPYSLQLAVISRIKILSNMDIAEKRRPQDGKIEMRAGSTDLDIRCSTLPLGQGESVVMRFLIRNAVKFDLQKLGYAEDLIARVNEDLKRTSGVILMTGPTGSGKTTSLYSFLNQINTLDIKIITLEDPIEYQLPGINQVQVNPDIGFDFSAGLRSIVRQDPDVIMVGEIRDNETAKIALQSALTGHLVFSTVHTNDAPSAYTRLMELGIEEYLLNAGLVSIMAQRLARTLCHHCKKESDEPNVISKYDLADLAKRYNIENFTIYASVGCSHCENSGYLGRVAFLEYLPCDVEVKRLPKDEKLLDNLYLLMKNNNLRSLKEDGFLKALQGVTSIDEVLRVAG